MVVLVEGGGSVDAAAQPRPDQLNQILKTCCGSIYAMWLLIDISGTAPMIIREGFQSPFARALSQSVSLGLRGDHTCPEGSVDGIINIHMHLLIWAKCQNFIDFPALSSDLRHSPSPTGQTDGRAMRNLLGKTKVMQMSCSPANDRNRPIESCCLLIWYVRGNRDGT